MGCNCGDNEYNITVDNNGNCEPTTPIYNITLANVGVNGYSPIVRFVNETVEGFNITVDNVTGTETSPAVPKLSYVSDQINNINTTIANLGNTYLTVNGSNAANPITLNHLTMGYQYGSPYINSDGNLYIRGAVLNLQATGDISLSTTRTNKAYYNSKEIATVDQIPTVSDRLYKDGSNADNGITLNGISLYTSGTYTSIGKLNSSNILQDGISIKSGQVQLIADKTNYAFGKGLNLMNGKVYYTVGSGQQSDDELAIKGDLPTTFVGCDSITGGAAGLVPAPSAGDQDKFLKGDGTWDTVGGGGSSYTAGTGIDITNDTISVDESVVMTTSNQSTINFGAKQFSIVTIANGFNTNAGLLGKKNVSGSLYLAQVSSSDDIILGDGTAPLYLMGSNNRPKYTGGNITAQDLALYSDIPTNYLTTNTSQTISTGTKTMASGTSQVFVNGSSLDIRGNNTLFLRGASQAQGGYLGLAARSRDTVNNVAINIIRLQANTTGDLANLRLQGYDLYNNPYLYNGFTRLGQVSISSGDINITTESGVELQYNGNEIATVNNIPDVSELEEKFAVGDGLEFTQGGQEIQPVVTLPYTFTDIYTGVQFFNNLTSGETKTAVFKIPSTGSSYYIGNDARRGIRISWSGDDIWLCDARSGEDYNWSHFTSSTDNYLKIISYNGGATDVFYSHDNSTWTLLMDKDRPNQLMGFGTEVGIYVEGDLITVDYFKLYYGTGTETTLNVDNTIARVSDIPTNNNQLTNGAGYITNSALSGYATENFVTSQGYITGITSSDVTTALGYTPYNATNPNGYITGSALNGYAKTADLATVATSGSYNDLTNKPTIPTVGNGTVTINQGGTQKGTFTLNQSGNTTINLDTGGSSYIAGTGIDIDTSSIPIISIDSTVVATKNELTDFVTISELNNEILPNYARHNEIPTAISDLTNDSGYITNSALTGYATQTWVGQQGYLTSSALTNYITEPTLIATLERYQTVLISGENIKTINNTSLLGSENIVVADTDLSNLSTTGQTVIDGQWVKKSATLAINVTWKTNTAQKTYSLSSYLPDDGYNYEVLFSGVAVTGTTSGNFVTIQLSTTFVDDVSVCEARTRTASSMESQGNAILPIGSNREVTQYSSSSTNANGTYSLYVKAYRRIGTNS